MSNIDDSEVQCNQSVARKVISGVVGAASSVTSIQVANLLRLFRIPQVNASKVVEEFLRGNDSFSKLDFLLTNSHRLAAGQLRTGRPRASLF